MSHREDCVLIFFLSFPSLVMHSPLFFLLYFVFFGCLVTNNLVSFDSLEPKEAYRLKSLKYVPWEQSGAQFAFMMWRRLFGLDRIRAKMPHPIELGRWLEIYLVINEWTRESFEGFLLFWVKLVSIINQVTSSDKSWCNAHNFNSAMAREVSQLWRDKDTCCL